MLSEKEFINKVWIDYEKYESQKKKKDKFYEKHVYKNTESLVLLKSVAMFLLVFTITATLVGGTYAAIKTITENNKKIEQQAAKAEDGSYEYYQENHNRNDYEENIQYLHNIGYEYHKINTYKEYLEAKEVISGLIEMTEEDFENNFAIVIGTFQAKSFTYQGLYIKDIFADDEKLTIILDINDNNDNLDVSAKLPVDIDREKINILFDIPKPEMTEYKPVAEIMADYKNYTKEQAEADKCIVIDSHYGDSEGFDKFLEETKQGKNGCIRVISYGDGGIAGVRDIEYKDGEYFIEYTFFSEIYPVINNSEIKKRYYKGDTFEVNKRVIDKSDVSEITYSLIDTKREKVLLERFNKKVKEEYEKELKYLYDKDTRLATYKYWEEEKGNIFDESKIDEYDKLYEDEYKKAVEERIDRNIKQPYEWTVEGRVEQKEEIFSIYKYN